RVWWRLRVCRRAPSTEEVLQGIRLTVTGVGLAWGVGAAMAIPALQPHEGALVLVVVTGIIAGATSTLVGDRRSFRYLLITTLAPLPIGILLQGQSRFNVIATILIVLFAVWMDRVHRRGYRTFAERVRGGVLLESSTQELARQHAYLDALIASTPVAIAVLDNQRVVRSVNPAFEALFGYSAAEVVGAGIDRLIVPEALRSESSELETRVRRGGLVLGRTSSEALLTILNDILDYSKIEAEHLELEAIPFDLPKVVHATATLLAVRAREKHLELTVDVPPDVPQMVRGDPTRV